MGNVITDSLLGMEPCFIIQQCNHGVCVPIQKIQLNYDKRVSVILVTVSV